jgi:hypothetical protein
MRRKSLSEMRRERFNRTAPFFMADQAEHPAVEAVNQPK